LVLIVMVGLASYTVADRVPRRWSVSALVGAEAVLGVALGVAMARGIVGDNGLQGLLPVAAAWFVGDSIAVRRRYIAGLVEQVEQRRSAEAERSRQFVREERVRIARELHDVVAHSLTVMTVQADVGRRVMADRPEEMRAALKSIEATGRAAQNELRVVLGLFRDDGGAPAELAPAPGLSDLDALVEKVRSAGTPVELRCRGLDHELSAALGLSVFRIVQEALTNVVKHAPGAHASVDLVVSARAVRIEIVDDGGTRKNGQSASPGGQRVPVGSQHGIVGMRERVSAFGGSLTAGRELGVGFRVVACIPVQEP
jgi:signal transduction histidine kinase